MLLTGVIVLLCVVGPGLLAIPVVVGDSSGAMALWRAPSPAAVDIIVR